MVKSRQNRSFRLRTAQKQIILITAQNILITKKEQQQLNLSLLSNKLVYLIKSKETVNDTEDEEMQNLAEELNENDEDQDSYSRQSESFEIPEFTFLNANNREELSFYLKVPTSRLT